MLVTARACQGAFAAILVPSALSLLTTTFTEQKDRGKAFGIYGAIAVAGGAVGLLLGGALTEYLSWRWTLYVNLIFAAVAFTGGALLLQRQASPARPKLDIPGVLLVSSAVFCLVYECSNAATHGWESSSSYGLLVAGVALLAVFALWQGQAGHPLLPLRVVLDPDADRAGVGPRLRHHILVDRRDFRRRSGHRRRSVPPRAVVPEGHVVPVKRRSEDGTSRRGSRSAEGSSVTLRALPIGSSWTIKPTTVSHFGGSP